MPVAVTSFISARGIAWRELAAASCVMLIPGLLFGILLVAFSLLDFTVERSNERFKMTLHSR